MQFDFYSTRSILVKRGGSAQLAKLAQEQGASKVLIVTDPGVLSAGDRKSTRLNSSHT